MRRSTATSRRCRSRATTRSAPQSGDGLALRGDFARGWPEYEWRWRCRGRGRPLAPLPQPRWQGDDLAGRTILLHSEQGLGDSLQSSAMRVWSRSGAGGRAADLPEPLARLLATCPGVGRVLPTGSPVPEFDVQAPLMSLPNILGTTLDTIPAEVPYLFAAAERSNGGGTGWARLRGSGRHRLAGETHVSLRSSTLFPAGQARPLARVGGGSADQPSERGQG